MYSMLYLGTDGNLPLRAGPDLAVEEVETAREPGSDPAGRATGNGTVT